MVNFLEFWRFLWFLHLLLPAILFIARAGPFTFTSLPCVFLFLSSTVNSHYLKPGRYFMVAFGSACLLWHMTRAC